MRELRFTRDPRGITLGGFAGPNVPGVLGTLRDRYERVIGTDLCLGSWRAHQAATELCGQLGTEGLPPTTDAFPGAGSPVGRGLDAQTAGDLPVSEALQLAGQLAAALREEGEPTAVVVLLPLDGEPLERPDALFVGFLAQALAGTAHQVALLFPGVPGGLRPELPECWEVTWTAAPAPETRPSRAAGDLAAMVPGVVSPLVRALLGTPETAPWLMGLPRGHLLVDPAERPRPPETARLAALGEAAAGIPWLAAYAAAAAPGPVADPWLLAEHARHEGRHGATRLALHLLARAETSTPSPARRAVIQLQAQGLRIIARHFGEAGSVPDPGPGLPPTLHALLTFTKGWSLTMGGRPAEATGLLEQACRLLAAEEGSWEHHLYALNITALNRLRLGDWDGALALEQQIRARLAARPHAWQLRYVNALNLARLHRIGGDPELARSLYREAFFTVEGVRSDSDALYEEVALARLAEAQAKTGEALASWVRAALCWASSDIPEAIAPRVTAALAGAGEANVVDAVSASLSEKLRQSAEAAGLHLRPLAANAQPPVFAGPQAGVGFPAGAGPWRAIVGPAWGLLGTPAETTPAVRSPATLGLRQTLTAVLDAAGGLPGDVRTLVVDQRLGLGLASGEHELVESSLRLGIPALHTAHGVVVLTGEPAEALVHQTVVSVGPAVGAVDGAGHDGRAAVHFKRYLPPAALTRAEASIVAAAGGRPAIGALKVPPDLRGHAALLASLRSLEDRRVIRLQLPAGLPPAAPGGP